MGEEYRTSRDSYGLLINPDTKLHRKWFKEMTRLIGINVIYRPPLVDKQYTPTGELFSHYGAPQVVGCIFEEHPTQQTTRKLGWVAELSENSSIIHVPYDLQDLQKGAIFIVPSGIDNAIGRVFKVVRMSNIMVYPASISCEIVPEYKNNFDESQFSHADNTFNLLNEEED